MTSGTRDNFFQKVLQILAVAFLISLQVISFLVIPPIVIYFIFFTRFWWIYTLYITWYVTMDKNSSRTGQRRNEWVRSWSCWFYVKDYFPLEVVKAYSVELDPKKNYLFCYHPHGLLSLSSIISLATNATELQKLFPFHTSFIHTINAFYLLPFMRELALMLGGVNVSRETLENILGKKEGGNISGLLVGGAEEAVYAMPGLHKILLKKRKGFVKIALRTGAPLVPVYCFGENELFTPVQFDQYHVLKILREFIRKNFGISVVIPVGRRDLLGLIPRRVQLTIVVGEPIDVQKTENPIQEEIDNLHLVFEKKLVELFEDHKKYYVKDYKNAHLEIL